MGFLYGLVGALLGSILGGATAFLLASAAMDGDGLGVFFTMIIWGSVGLIMGAIFGVVLALCVLHYVKSHQQGSQAKRKNTFVVSGFVLAVPVLVMAIIWKAEQYQYPPSDQQLLNNFNYHRTEFDELAQMRQVDTGLMRVGDDRTQPSNPKTVGVSPERIGRYRQLLRFTGVRQGLEADGLRGTDLICWAQGGATSSDTDKGYAYLNAPPKQVRNNLDQLPLNGIQESEAYRHVEGCWYLYYDYLPG